MKLSTQLFERSKKVTPGGVHSPVRAFIGVEGTPFFVDRGEGPFLYDVDDNCYVDFCMSWGPLIFGHSDPDILEAVELRLRKGSSFGTAEPISLELAELMVSKIPFLEMVRFVNSGTEAVMSAVRLARGFTGRSKILKFDGCYHGHMDCLLVQAGSGLAEMASPNSAGIPKKHAEDTVVVELDDLEKLEEAFKLHGSDLAAVIIEPLPANNGLLIQDPTFLKDLRKICTKNGTLLIFDEVISGFRIGFGGMAEEVGVEPDLVTYGKVIGGGFPVGAYGGKKQIMEKIAPLGSVYQAGTLSANPVAMEAGLTTLKKLIQENPYTSLQIRTEKLVDRLNELFSNNDKLSMQAISKGSLFWLMDTSDRKERPTRASQISGTQNPGFAPLFHGLLKKGVYLAPSGYEVGFLSTAHDPSVMDRTIEAFETVIEKYPE